LIHRPFQAYQVLLEDRFGTWEGTLCEGLLNESYLVTHVSGWEDPKFTRGTPKWVWKLGSLGSPKKDHKVDLKHVA